MTSSAALAARPTAQVSDLGDHLARVILQPNAIGLIVAFESADYGIDRTNAAREAEGERFFLRNRFSVIALLAKRRTWYRTPDVTEFLAGLAAGGVGAAFPYIATYGVSMGAFGALSFARLLGAHVAMAVDPVSTLAPDLAAFEHRFPSGRSQNDWRGPLRDGAAGAAHTPIVSLIYDPLDRTDRAHARRIAAVRSAEGRETREIKAPGLGHGSAVGLARIGALGPAVIEGLTADGDPAQVRGVMRRRRRLDRYYETLAAHPRAKGRATRQAVIAAHRARVEAAGELIETPKLEDVLGREAARVAH